MPNGWWHSVEALEASVSISGRGLSLCEGLSFLPYWLALLAQGSLRLPEAMAQHLPTIFALLPLLIGLLGRFLMASRGEKGAAESIDGRLRCHESASFIFIYASFSLRGSRL